MHVATLILLIAEDDEDDVFLISRALQIAGLPATTHFVADGQEAIDYLAGQGKYADRQTYPLPHMAFFDIKMTRRTGLEALHWVRAQAQFQHLPVMIISASSEECDLQRAHLLGVTAYVVKPVSLELLAQELKRFYMFWGPMAVARWEALSRQANLPLHS